MARLGRRNRKVVDYSEFGNLEDDDEDFAPSSKKSRTQSKEQKKEKKEKQKKPPKEVTPSQTQTLSKRLSLDDKLYKRDLEVALALSVKEKPANILEVQNSEEQDKNIKSENMHRTLPFSNCSVDSELLGLNQVTDEDTPKAEGGQRTVTSKAPAQQKVVDIDDREHDSDSEPESVPISPVVSPSWTTKQKPEPRQKKMMSSSSEQVGWPLLASSPVTHKKPKWTPPAPSGSSNASEKYIAIKSPTHSLRLGLSRLARVKPLHPSTTSS